MKIKTIIVSILILLPGICFSSEEKLLCDTLGADRCSKLLLQSFEALEQVRKQRESLIGVLKRDGYNKKL
ncbi:hypothetical protein [Microbulbifer epialgicus]|uniref:Uncharacterized protein n=1 Tax=Microbulbifer epialgicus TaxID=393907 RepID=A0ABV4NTY0_9GAMM